jgi:hypothetical protein
MAMDGIGPSSGISSPPTGFVGQMSKRSVVQPQVAEPTGFSGVPGSGAAIGTARGLSDTFQDNTLTQQWGISALRWGGRETAAHAINSALGVQQAAPPPKASFLGNLKQKFSKSAKAAAASAPKSYSQWLNLGTDKVDIRHFNMTQYKETVQKNLQNAKNPFTLEAAKKLGNAETWKSYGRQTLIQNNFKPIKDLMSNEPNKNWGAGLSRIFGLGYAGYDVVKHTKETWEQTHDISATAMAAGKYLVRAAALWEVAGVGAAVGSAVLAVSAGPVWIGAILGGTLFALIGSKILNPILRTGDSDPNLKKRPTEPAQDADVAQAV